MKKVIIILVPLLLIGGGVFFAASKGMINIPGISPKKPAPNLYGEGKDPKPTESVPETSTSVPEEQPAESIPEPKPSVEEDPKLGQTKIASLWNEMDVVTLERTITTWTDDELAPILNAMNTEKVTELLSKMAQSDAKRASRLTKALQVEASKKEPEPIH